MEHADLLTLVRQCEALGDIEARLEMFIVGFNQEGPPGSDEEFSLSPNAFQGFMSILDDMAWKAKRANEEISKICEKERRR